MILEEKIVKIIILISIFFGVYNLFGQFNSFLTPFIFNYATVSIVGFLFVFQNRKEAQLKLLSLFSFSIAGIAIFSGQFTYLLNLFSTNKIAPIENELILFLLFLVFIFSLFYALYCLIRDNENKQVKIKLATQLALFIVYVFSFFLRIGISDYLLLLFSIVFATNLLSSKMKISPGIHRMILLIFLNCSLEILKLISIAFV